jgi:translation initiation factor eIF-2B subunit delta
LQAPPTKTAAAGADAGRAGTAGGSASSHYSAADSKDGATASSREAQQAGSTSGSSRGGGPQATGKMLQLFSHLGSFKKGKDTAAAVGLGPSDIHPAIAALGQRYASGDVRGANARAVALLAAFREVVRDYVTPPDKMLSWDLDKRLRPQIQFLIDCRPHSVSMGNAIKFMRNTVAKVPPEMGEAAAKAHICDEIDAFISERVVIAGDSIADHGNRKISDGDVLLTFGSSSLVRQVLTRARRTGKDFRVVVVDSRPVREGRSMAAALSAEGIPVTYILLGAVSYIMREVTKVFLGSSALMANGAVLSRVGTAVVAMMARSYGIPVMFCCETYKFCERVQLDSVVYNELGHPEELLAEGGTAQERADWAAIPALKLLNLRYDLTPIKYVDLVITEIGIIPPTSVPVLLREMSIDR